MGNFTLSEILTIVLVILIVFGPNRLPEMARKAGEWTAKARRAASSFKAEIRAEYGDSIEPIKQVRDDLRGIGSEMREGVAKMDRGVRDTLGSVKDDFEAEVNVTPHPGSTQEGATAEPGAAAPPPSASDQPSGGDQTGAEPPV